METQWSDWTPTAANVNALPERLRRYIHDIETRCDPAGDIRELTIARDTCKALEANAALGAFVRELFMRISDADSGGNGVFDEGELYERIDHFIAKQETK